MVPKFSLIFHDSNKKYLFSKHQNKAEFRNLDDSAIISSDIPGLRTFAATVLLPCSEYPRHKPFLLTPVLRQK
jgi:hypothetical protein